MFVERNYQQEKTNSLVRDCPLCDIYFCGNTDNGDDVGLECGVPETWDGPVVTEIPEQGNSATWAPAYVTGLKDSYDEVSEIKGKWERGSFLVYALEASLCSQARRQETNCNN